MMFERRKEKEEDLGRTRNDARHDFERERERLEREREALEAERKRLEELQEELEARQEQLEDVEGQLEDLQDELDAHEEELEDAESIKELLDVVSQGIPGVMRGIQEAVYSPEQSKQMALTIAEFYKTLVEAGIPDYQAQGLTHTHMTNLQATMRRTARVRFPDRPHPPGEPSRQVHEHWPHPTPGDDAEEGA
jgi:septal ring factor EnvC (AmiA/AmiB activator)